MFSGQINRRGFLKTAVIGSAAIAAVHTISGQQPKNVEFFTLPPLPYAENSLEPIISAKTISFHYGKHHKGYVDRLNQLTTSTEFAKMPLEAIMKKTDNVAEKSAIFNNAAQSWNHTFFWNSLKPKAGGPAKGAVAELIQKSFGSYETFKTTYLDTATNHFGSGYAWLVYDGTILKTMSTVNANNPMTQNLTPILTIDVWEHAYYLDYQ
ncbi:MAG: superoxide dismutase, partial [Chitinivibrionales bacterium]|nr:superoxide dismutase [Chitinivibrionales bacterium]